MPKVSVIMPVYNAMPYLEDAINSIERQNLKDFEIICIDDGSTDESLKLLKKHAALDERFKILSQCNLGAGAARNKGLLHAQGEYVAFLDADDYFYPNLLTEAVARAEGTSSDIVIYRFERYDVGTHKIEAADYAFRKEYWPSENFSYKSCPDKAFVSFNPCAWNKLFRRAFLQEQELKFQELKRTNDLFFTSSAMVAARRISLLDKVLVRYTIGNAQSSQATNALAQFDFLKALSKLKSYLEQKGLYEELKQGYGELCDNTLLHNLRSTGTKGYTLFRSLVDDEIEKLGLSLEELPQVKAYGQRFAYEALLARCEQAAKVEANLLIKGNKETLPAISVIIPVYNVEQYLAPCLDSVLGQNFQDWEIITLDDGSKDNSLQILREYANREPRITVLQQMNAGLSMARNNAVKHARGKYLYFLDSDDMLTQEALAKLYAKAEADSLDLLYFDAQVFFEEPELETDAADYKYYYERAYDYSGIATGPELMLAMQRHNEYRPSVPLQLIKADFYREHKLEFSPGMLYEDNLFTFKSLLLATRASHLGERLYLRRLRKDSIISKKPTFVNSYSYYYCLQEMRKIMAHKSYSVELKTVFADLCKRIGDSAAETFVSLSVEEQEVLQFLPLDARKFYEKAVKEHESKGFSKLLVMIDKTINSYKAYGFRVTLRKIVNKITSRIK